MNIIWRKNEIFLDIGSFAMAAGWLTLHMGTVLVLAVSAWVASTGDYWLSLAMLAFMGGGLWAPFGTSLSNSGANQLSPKRIDIALAFPGLSQAELEQPLAGQPTARLSISAYRIRTVRYDKGESMVRWHPLHELGLELAASSPLILRVERPHPMSGAIGGHTQEELLLELTLERLNQRGQYRTERHTIRLAPDKPGEYPAGQANIQGQAAARLQVAPLLLPDAQDAASR